MTKFVGYYEVFLDEDDKTLSFLLYKIVEFLSLVFYFLDKHLTNFNPLTRYIQPVFSKLIGSSHESRIEKNGLSPDP